MSHLTNDTRKSTFRQMSPARLTYRDPVQGTPNAPRPSFTERLARASASRPRRVLALWGAALVLVLRRHRVAPALRADLRGALHPRHRVQPRRRSACRTPAGRAGQRRDARRPLGSAVRRPTPLPGCVAASAARSPRSAPTSSRARRRRPRRPPTATPSRCRCRHGRRRGTADENIGHVMTLSRREGGPDGLTPTLPAAPASATTSAVRPRRTCRPASSSACRSRC